MKVSVTHHCKFKKNTAKRLSALLTFVMLTLCLFSMTSCTYTTDNKSALKTKDNTTEILCTNFAQYDWVKNITENADNINVSLLFKNGVDVHSFQPTADDILKIAHSDLLIYGGGESDTSIEDILKNSAPDTASFSCMEAIKDNALQEDESIAIQQSRFHNHTHTDTEIIEHDEHDEHNHTEHLNHNHESGTEYDEHFWLSVKRAKTICQKITEKLCTLNPENSEIYEQNTKAYCEKLDELDSDYASVISSAVTNKLIFADRFPFLYLARDYNLDCIAAFSGCSAETSASFKTIISLADKLNELNLDKLIIIDNSYTKTADTVIRTSGRKNVDILTLNSLQAVTKADLDNNITYLSVMQNNLNTINKALNP